jgi:hypothetical protein
VRGRGEETRATTLSTGSGLVAGRWRCGDSFAAWHMTNASSAISETSATALIIAMSVVDMPSGSRRA